MFIFRGGDTGLAGWGWERGRGWSIDDRVRPRASARAPPPAGLHPSVPHFRSSAAGSYPLWLVNSLAVPATLHGYPYAPSDFPTSRNVIHHVGYYLPSTCPWFQPPTPRKISRNKSRWRFVAVLMFLIVHERFWWTDSGKFDLSMKSSCYVLRVTCLNDFSNEEKQNERQRRFMNRFVSKRWLKSSCESFCLQKMTHIFLSIVLSSQDDSHHLVNRFVSKTWLTSSW